MVRLFRHYVSRGLLVLASVEALIFFLSAYAGRVLTAISYQYELKSPTLGEALIAYQEQPLRLVDAALQGGVLAVTMVVTLIAMGLYERNFWDGRGDMILRVAIGFVIGFFVLTLIYYVIPDVRLWRREFSFAFSLAFIGVMMARVIFFRLSDQNALKRRVLVLGCGQRAAEVEALTRPVTASCAIVGFVHIAGDNPAIDPQRVVTVGGGLFEYCERNEIDEIIIAIDDRSNSVLPMEDVLDCKIGGVQVSDLLSFIERETGKISLEGLLPSDMIYSDGFHQAVLKRFSKRLFDLLVSLALLLLTAPLMMITALAVWLESYGRDPIFYFQERVGRNDRIFKVIKFRSMRVDAERDGQARWAEKNDPRVTRVGSLIRRIRADELPQLFNVLLGQMSFVGPRPERPQLVEELEAEIPYYSLRHRVKPGITGWAQLCYPYGSSVDDARRKLEYDLYYIKNYSLFLDFIVLLQTAHVVLWAKGT